MIAGVFDKKFLATDANNLEADKSSDSTDDVNMEPENENQVTNDDDDLDELDVNADFNSQSSGFTPFTNFFKSFPDKLQTSLDDLKHIQDYLKSYLANNTDCIQI